MSTECDSGLEQEDQSQYKKGGYHPTEIGDLLLNRYLIKKKIGWGQFSTVWLCFDSETNSYVALKIQKSALYYTNAAEAEIDILQNTMKNSDDPNWIPLLSNNKKTYIVNLLNTFTHRGPNGRHVCMIFEILGISLLEVIKIYEYKGIPIELCRSFFAQILSGLDYLHRFNGVIHTDLKPENILIELAKIQVQELLNLGEIKTQIKRKVQKIEDIPKPLLINTLLPEEKLKKILKKKRYRKKKQEQRSIVVNASYSPQKKKKRKINQKELFFTKQLNIKIVDFGNAVYSSSLCNNEIQTRQYRAPEVILGNNYTTAADI